MWVFNYTSFCVQLSSSCFGVARKCECVKAQSAKHQKSKEENEQSIKDGVKVKVLLLEVKMKCPGVSCRATEEEEEK